MAEITELTWAYGRDANGLQVNCACTLMPHRFVDSVLRDEPVSPIAHS
jgi:hypothetical protein